MKFGLDEKKTISGAGLYARIFQITALLSVLYTIVVPNAMSVITASGLLSFLFDLGFSAMPRAEALALSLLYRLTLNEVLVHFAVLFFALFFGVAVNQLLQGKKAAALAARRVFAILIAADLLLRLIPASFNRAFGPTAAVLGFAVRLLCLVLVLLDLRDARNGEKT